MAHSLRDQLDRMPVDDLSDFLKLWLRSLSDDKFSRVLDIVKLESNIRDKCHQKSSHRKHPHSETNGVVNLSMSNNVNNGQSTSGSSIDTVANWFCVFCKKTAHESGLGDLFGPYFIKKDEFSNDSTATRLEISCQKPKVDKKKKKVNEDSKPIDDTNIEIWFHDTCVAWTSGVYLVGHLVQNVEEMVRDSAQNVCSVCRLNGANLGCIAKSCKRKFHYPCANESGCEMDQITFSTTCNNHQQPSSSNSQIV